MITRLESTMPKLEKYIKRFRQGSATLIFPREQHTFPHLSLCEELFDQWGKYDVC